MKFKNKVLSRQHSFLQKAFWRFHLQCLHQTCGHKGIDLNTMMLPQPLGG